jgi:kynurenine formamidase
VFGAGDQLGALGFITPEVTRESVAEVSEGRIFNLDYPLNTFVPSIAGTRPATEHHIFANNPNHRDDWLDSFYLQSTSQIDGLRHMRHPDHGFFGAVADDAIVEGRPELGIQLVAEKGIVTRGVLVDMPAYFAENGTSYDPSARFAIRPGDLEGALDRQGVALRAGDVLLLNTGWAEAYLAVDAEERNSRHRRSGTPGLHQSHEMLEYLWDSGIAMVASDNPGVEMFPVDPDSGFLRDAEPTPERGPQHNGMMHRPLLALLGIYLGECWKLDELTESCRKDGRYTVLLTAKPLNLIGGVGSPPNAMALK